MDSFPSYQILKDENGNVITSITDVHGVTRLATSIRPLGEVDAGNSTSTPLTGGGVFTGVWHDAIDAIHIAVAVSANVASATDGVRIEWSVDGSTVFDFDAFTLDAGANKIWTFGPHTRYFRVKFTNGASAQSTFGISTLIKTAYQKASSHRVTETISNQDDAELVKAVITGEDDTGTFQNVRTDSRGNLFTTVAKVITPVHEYDGFNNDTTKISYTVPTGKKLWISGWNLAAVSDAAGHAFALRIGSTQISWCCVNNDGTTTINRLYTDSNPFGPVSAGSVVTVQRIEGSSPENWGVELDGFLEDA